MVPSNGNGKNKNSELSFQNFKDYINGDIDEKTKVIIEDKLLNNPKNLTRLGKLVRNFNENISAEEQQIFDTEYMPPTQEEQENFLLRLREMESHEQRSPHFLQTIFVSIETHFSNFIHLINSHKILTAGAGLAFICLVCIISFGKLIPNKNQDTLFNQYVMNEVQNDNFLQLTKDEKTNRGTADVRMDDREAKSALHLLKFQYIKASNDFIIENYDSAIKTIDQLLANEAYQDVFNSREEGKYLLCDLYFLKGLSQLALAQDTSQMVMRDDAINTLEYAVNYKKQNGLKTTSRENYVLGVAYLLSNEKVQSKQSLSQIPQQSPYFGNAQQLLDK